MGNDEAKVPSEWVTVLSRPQDAHNEATIRLHPGLRPLTFEGPAATFKHFCGDLAALNWQDPSWESQEDALANIFLAGIPDPQGIRCSVAISGSCLIVSMSTCPLALAAYNAGY